MKTQNIKIPLKILKYFIHFIFNSCRPNTFEAIALKNNFMFVSMDDFW